MKKTFFLLCALLLVLGTLLPIAGYRLTLAVFGPAQGAQIGRASCRERV